MNAKHYERPDRSGKPVWSARLRTMRGPLLAACFLLLASPVLAQSGEGYDLTWSTVDGGGGTLTTGGVYSVIGTIGQPEAGLVSGGDFTVGGGFLPGGEVAAGYRIYLPVVLRNWP
jgi:hypothetical protein